MNHLRVGKHLPLHFKEMYPKLVAFIETYYEFMNDSGFMNSVIRSRIQNGETELVRDDAEAFVATLDERLSGLDQQTADIHVSDWRAPNWWSANMMSILNMERIPESFLTSEQNIFKTSDGETYQSNFVHKKTIENWMKDAGFPEASAFGGDAILTSRILRSLYQLKGTSKALELFFNVFYGEQVTIINPNKLIACIDDNFILDSNVQIKDDLLFSEYSIIVQSEHPREYYEPLYTDVYLKMFHPAGFGVSFSDAVPNYNEYNINKLDPFLSKPYAPHISNTGMISVKGIQGGNSWEYTTNYGSRYIKGFGTSFQLPDGVYSEGRVGVRQVTPYGELGETTFMSEFVIETSKPEITAGIDSEYKRIRGQTIPRVEVKLMRYNGDVIQTTKSDSKGVYRFLFSSGITRGEYLLGVTSNAGNENTISLTVDYRNKSLPIPTLVLSNDSGESNKDYITNDGKVIVEHTEGYNWEYSVDGGFNWNDGSGNSFRLKHGSYKMNSIMVRTKEGRFHSTVNALSKNVQVILLLPKIDIKRVNNTLEIYSKDVKTISIFRNGSYIKTIDLVSNAYSFSIELVDWDMYVFKSTDAAGNKVEQEYTIQII